MKKAIFLLFGCLPVFAAGSVWQSIAPIGTGQPQAPEIRVHSISIVWTGDAITGTVPSTLISIISYPALQGMRLISAEFQPNTPNPTPNYSITLTDPNGIDLLQGAGASLSATNAAFTGSVLSPPLLASPTFNLSGNSVAGAKGTVTLFFAPLSMVAGARGLPATLPASNNFTGLINTFTNAGVFTPTQMNDYGDFLIGGLNTTTEQKNNVNSVAYTQALVGGVLVPSTSTVPSVAGVTGLVQNNSTTTVPVAGYDQCRVLVNNASCFGANIVATDHPGGQTAGVSLTSAEFDTGPQSPVTAYSGIFGVTAVIGGTNSSWALGAGVGGSAAFLASGNTPLPGTPKSWETAFRSADARASRAFRSGALCTLASMSSCNSEGIQFDGATAGAYHSAVITGDASGNIIMSPATSQNTQFQGYIVPNEIAQPGVLGAGNEQLWADSTGHNLKVILNGGGAGPLVTAAPCTTSQKTESAADANLLTCAIVSQAGSYRIRFVLDVSAANTATLGWTATWTGSNGTAFTPTNLSVNQQNVGVPASTFTFSGPTMLYGYADVDVNNSGTSIVVKLTFSGTSFTGKATATVERIV